MRWNRVALLIVLAAAGLFLGGCANMGDPSRNFSTVILDAGHGGYDSGASPRGRGREKELTLDVVRRIERKLKAAGINTVLTRNRDAFVALYTRSAISNQRRGAIFVSIHFNYSPRTGISGIETYYYKAQDRDFAIAMESGAVSRTGANRRGIIREAFYVLRTNRNPAVLIECGYLTNWSESARCQSEAYREQLAEGIAQAIIKRRAPGAASGGAVTGRSRPRRN